MTPARTRVAPSPTGFIHIGTLRTALYDYLLAKKTGGQYILRVEDTDRSRFVEGALENLLNVFDTVNLQHDEGPFLVNGEIEQRGDHGPYIQSERLDKYQPVIDQLIRDENAYYCFCTKERLDVMREEQRATKQTPKYDRHCLTLTPEEVQQKLAEKTPFVVRMKVPEGETHFEDAVRGSITINHAEVDDQVIQKSDGYPTYHLAVVVDDHDMQITHVLRGEEWISSTPKQIILFNMLGWEVPVFAHLPLLLNPNKKKLSKRQGDVAVEDFLKKGYLPQALINFVALLGFNPRGDQELYSMQELIENFELSKVNKAGAVVNVEKLNWMNNHYIKQLSEDELCSAIAPFISFDIDNNVVRRAAMNERERIQVLTEFEERIGSYMHQPSYNAELLVWRKADASDAKMHLENLKTYIESISDDVFDSRENIERELKKYIEDGAYSNGNVLWPLRVALSGLERSAGPFEYLWALGKKESITRITNALDLV